ncbi:hypothetical protein O9G_003092 [Rozella allomycis CSF55]|uniref:Uncharacterized protein n=1 Tax=Rozella allomycis (strain CSF55) TaxID=988480 RepID=A0A075AS72_ROZAC|nr:hypothetical protein O9G_003092 [Rozella allomycis CSF55]|eukprot:EPZ33096.1 hypothetical protein O9G_003092 [Rozella allomycis CSF55]
MKRINRIRIVRHKPVVGTVSRLYFSGDTKSRVSDDFAEETMSPSLYGIVPEPGDKHSDNKGKRITDKLTEVIEGNKSRPDGIPKEMPRKE